MKCTYCHGSDLEKKTVEEEFKKDGDVVLVPVEAIVCSSCGERYYSRKSMRLLEEWSARIKSNKGVLQPIGRVLKAAV